MWSISVYVHHCWWLNFTLMVFFKRYTFPKICFHLVALPPVHLFLWDLLKMSSWRSIWILSSILFSFFLYFWPVLIESLFLRKYTRSLRALSREATFAGNLEAIITALHDKGPIGSTWVFSYHPQEKKWTINNNNNNNNNTKTCIAP